MMLMRCKSVIDIKMDSVLNANGITAMLLVLIVTVNCVHAIEYNDLNVPGNDLLVNGTSNSIGNSNSNSNSNRNGSSSGTLSTFNRTESGRGIGPPKVLSRRKRYVAFPEGSSFSVAFCATIGMIGNPELDYLSWALNWGLAYDLPNETWIIQHRHERPRPLVQRRHRRDLYNRLEVAIDNMGYNGRECILRALCESAQYFFGRGTNMVEELIRIVFTLPETKVLPFEHNDLHEYDSAHRMGKSNAYCSSTFRDCSISLIELALGRYAKPYNFM